MSLGNPSILSSICAISFLVIPSSSLFFVSAEDAAVG